MIPKAHLCPISTRGQDGYDVIEWCASQPWSDGNVGTIGSSYPGCIQWLAALQKPPHLKAMVVRVTPSDPFIETPTGLPSPIDTLLVALRQWACESVNGGCKLGRCL